MGKTTKGKKPQTQRPKGPGAKAPPRRVSTRVKKPAPTATELAASMAQRCGEEDCKVCNPQPCDNCAGCQHAAQKGWDPAKRCNIILKMHTKTCPNVLKPDDDDVDPRKLDKEGPHFKASDDIIAVMDALANSTQLAAPDLYALACFKDSLDKSGRLDARWVSLDKIKARDDYDIDDINANQEAAIEAVVREVHFKNGSKPSAEEMATMGPLEMLTVMRVLSYIAPMNYRTWAQSSMRVAAMNQSTCDQARDTFLAFVEGGQWDGVNVCTSLARKKDQPWPEYWQGCLDLLDKKYASFSGGPKRFRELLERLQRMCPAWACAPTMREWFEARQCRYQRMVSTTCHW